MVIQWSKHFNLPPCSSLTDQYGEPGQNFQLADPTVVGWGRTGTSADRNISIVATAVQQYLKMPLRGNSECVEMYRTLAGLDLSNDIRYSIWRHSLSCLLIIMSPGSMSTFVQVVRLAKTAAR